MLKTNQSYYFQVQGQLRVTGWEYCDFFIYTTVGFHLERIFLDKNLWQQMSTQFKWFWMNILFPELLQSLAKSEIEDDTVWTENVIKLMKHLQLWLYPQRCLYATSLCGHPHSTYAQRGRAGSSQMRAIAYKGEEGVYFFISLYKIFISLYKRSYYIAISYCVLKSVNQPWAINRNHRNLFDISLVKFNLRDK